MNLPSRLQLRRTGRIAADAAGMGLGIGQMGVDVSCRRGNPLIEPGIIADQLGHGLVLLIEDDRVF